MNKSIPWPEGHPTVEHGRVGILLVNLGTPEATDYWSMRSYLKEFLSDRRVIETPRWLWWPVLNLIILSRRPSVRGRDYDLIWIRDLNEGPLKTITRAQARKLGERLAAMKSARKIEVDWAMRYGKPSIGERLAALKRQGCDRILIFPLYPQYCAATTATVCDKAFAALQAMRWQPTLRVVPPYYDEPSYIDALAASMQNALAKLDFEPDVILASYHGIPPGLFRQRRSLLLPMRQDDAAFAGTVRTRTDQIAYDLSVAFRPRGMAEAVYRRHRQGSRGRRGRETAGGRYARLRGRLSGNAGRDRRRKCRLLSRRGWRKIRTAAVPQ